MNLKKSIIISLILLIFMFGCTQSTGEAKGLLGASENQENLNAPTGNNNELNEQTQTQQTQNPVPVLEAVTNCIDSDTGKNYFEKGTTFLKKGTITSGAQTDYCNGSTLHEKYCENNTVKDEIYNCESGCLEGACKLNSSESTIPLPNPIEEGELPIEEQKGNEYYQESEGSTPVEEIELPVEETPIQSPVSQSQDFFGWIMNFFGFN
ncbi:MAG: hypothetical protein JW703_01255 [Candidatus Diapherotrites archaeon]|nr:hypothetical protein [Candidatus Diapherotrites archaeon]